MCQRSLLDSSNNKNNLHCLHKKAEMAKKVLNQQLHAEKCPPPSLHATKNNQRCCSQDPYSPRLGHGHGCNPWPPQAEGHFHRGLIKNSASVLSKLWNSSASPAWKSVLNVPVHPRSMHTARTDAILKDLSCFGQNANISATAAETDPWLRVVTLHQSNDSLTGDEN